MMKLVEETSGEGELRVNGDLIRKVAYRITRYQGFVESSGLPVPGLHRIEGSIDCASGEFIGVSAALKLDDGRVLAVTIIDSAGRILSEGHGPSKCLCC